MTLRRTCYVLRKPRHRTPSDPGLWAHMEMPRICVEVPDDLARRVKAEATRLWPGHGRRALNRLTADALLRYRRYCDDPARPRAKRS